MARSAGTGAVLSRPAPPADGRRRDEPDDVWLGTYVRNTVAVDAVAGAVAGMTALYIRFGFGIGSRATAAYYVLSAAFPALWLAALWLSGAHEPRALGAGVEEWRRLAHAALALCAVVGFVAFATRYDLARGYVVLAIPLAAGGSLLGRSLLRRTLRAERAAGRCLHRVVAVGHADQVADLVRTTRRDPHGGLRVVALCVPGEERPALGRPDDPPVLGDLHAVTAAVRACRADTVAVTACPELAGPRLRRLSWELERTGTDLLVSPGLVEVSAARLHLEPVTGLSLLRVEHPTLSGSRRRLKGAIDRAGAALILLVLGPTLAAIAVAIRASSPGPALYRQRRVGRDGREFTLLKFRTMVADADQHRDELLPLNEADGPLFKIRNDPRVTRVGSWLRRHSFDELPQLLNVVKGDMSLVGPRPPLAEEVAEYDDVVHRRLRVKPGLTGLWQISGRSDLSWEESVRLDLVYVDNWSIWLDLLILGRTVSVVLGGRGAY